MSVVIGNPPHLAQQVAEGFAPYGVATVDETQGRTDPLGSFVRPNYASAKIPGSAARASFLPAVYGMLHVAEEHCQAGDVLVLAPASSSCGAEYFGERLACSLAARGVVGLVIEVGVRGALTHMCFPVWSTAVSAQRTAKETLGSVNVNAVCAGQIVGPGDLILADDDGVVVLRASAETMLRQTQAREAKEAQTRAQLAHDGLVYRPAEARD